MACDKALQTLLNNLKSYVTNDKFIDTELNVKKSVYEIIIDSVSSDITNYLSVQTKLWEVVLDYEQISTILFILILKDRINYRLNDFLTINREYKKDDSNVFDIINDDFNNFYECFLINNNEVSLRNDQLKKIFEISKEKAELYFSHIIHLIQHYTTCKINDNDFYITLITVLDIAGILNKTITNDRWEFYRLCDIVVSILNRNELFQNARNISEEIFYLSNAENNFIYGAYVQFNCFVEQKNPLSAIYFFLCFECLLTTSERNKEIWLYSLMSLQKLFRDIHLSDEQNMIFDILNCNYKNILTNLDWLQINLCNFYTKLTTSSLSTNDLELFIDSNRESIFSGQIDNIFTWYIFGKQVLEQNYYSDKLSSYINYFENCLPKDMIEYAYTLLGKPINIESRYNEIFERLDKTLYYNDMTSEIKNIQHFFNKMVDKSVQDRNYKYFITAFYLIVDQTTIKKEKYVDGLIKTEFSQNNTTIDYFNNLINKFISKKDSNVEFILLAENYDHLVSLNWDFQSEYYPEIRNEWALSEMDSILKELLKIIHFNPSGTDYDYEEEDKNFRKQNDIFKNFNLTTKTNKPVGIIADITLSVFPINLIQNSGEFIFLKKPVFSIPSIKSIFDNEKIEVNISQTSLWCPVESGDFTLNFLYSKLETFIDESNINTIKTVEITSQITGDIKIIIAHGGSNISETGILSASDTPSGTQYSYEKIEDLLINTKIVILFVCFSGKVTNDIFYKKNNSLLKKLFSNGAKVIISPKWPLHIDVPEIWLPEFLKLFKEGKSALESFHFANLKVYEKYKNCGAWACLHYSGLDNVYLA